MTRWALPPEDRHQMVIFSRLLDDVVSAEHPVRLLDEILGRITWEKWEAHYHTHLGQPPIHPKVVAGVLLHGLLTGIRSSRRLEEALVERLDFRWLAEGRTIDHTTLSEFRRGFGTELKGLFVQVALIAREMELLPLTRLAFDGTRIKANNRRSGTRTPAELREMREELSRKYAELEQQAAAEDARQQHLFGEETERKLPKELADVECRRQKIDQALAELKRAEDAGEALPKRLPLTDPESRVSPNKHGGFAPNYTPLATVDAETGFIVSVDVIAMTNEEQYLLAAVDDVQAQFGLKQASPEMLADGLLSTGPILAGLEERGVTMFSPVPDSQSRILSTIRPSATTPGNRFRPSNGLSCPRSRSSPAGARRSSRNSRSQRLSTMRSKTVIGAPKGSPCVIPGRRAKFAVTCGSSGPAIRRTRPCAGTVH